jgi:hypothetical protein
MYTLVDTFFLSKRARRSAVSIGNLKPEKKTLEQETSVTADDVDSDGVDSETDSEDEKDTQEMVSRNDAETGSSTEEKQSAPVAAVSQEQTTEVPKKEKKKLFGGFFSRPKKQKLDDTLPSFIPNKIDDAYLMLIDDFVSKTKGSWNQKEFYEFILILATKGYDKKPSEINRDVLVAKDKYRTAEIEQEKTVPKPESVPEEREVAPIEVLSEDDLEDEKQMQKETREQEAREESIHETIAKETARKKEVHKSTRQELDKTLSEIKELRERLKGL